MIFSAVLSPRSLARTLGITTNLVPMKGIEPLLTANLADRGYKSRRASNYTTQAINLEPNVGVKPTSTSVRKRASSAKFIGLVKRFLQVIDCNHSKFI